MAKSSKIILGIETSCDETAAAILQKSGDQITILSNIVASSASLQSKYGGIIPEQAAREQIKSIIPVIEEAILVAKLSSYQAIKQKNSIAASLHSSIARIDAIAVTCGPGLISSLLVGVETAKTLSLIWQKPLIPINHLIGHFYANWITEVSRGDSRRGAPSSPRSDGLEARRSDGAVSWQDPEKPALPSFPYLGLLATGGQTDLVLFKNHGDYKYLGGTRDDAAGECFDKCARILGLPYPGGPEISQLAQKGNPKAFSLPRPMIDSGDFDFSYSGLKTAVVNLLATGGRVRATEENDAVRPRPTSTFSVAVLGQDPAQLQNLCASIEAAIIDPLVKKTLKAAQTYNVKTIILGGGVAANEKLRSELKLQTTSYSPRSEAGHLQPEIFVPQKFLCTDNAAMIASAAFFQKPIANPLDLQADPNLSLT